MLSEIYPGRAPKMGANYWDQIYEIGIISVAKRLLKRLQELLEQVGLLFPCRTYFLNHIMVALSESLYHLVCFVFSKTIHMHIFLILVKKLTCTNN